MWVKFNWEGQVYPNPAGKALDVRPGESHDLPAELAEVVIAKGLAKKTRAPKPDGAEGAPEPEGDTPPPPPAETPVV